MTLQEAIEQLKYDRAMCLFNPSTGEEEPMNDDCRKSAEALGLAIEALKQQKKKRWIPVTERLPDLDEDGYSEKLLISFDNFSLPAIGEYRQDPDGSGAWYDGDGDEPLINFNLIVNAWMPLPEQYKEEL